MEIPDSLGIAYRFILPRDSITNVEKSDKLTLIVYE